MVTTAQKLNAMFLLKSNSHGNTYQQHFIHDGILIRSCALSCYICVILFVQRNFTGKDDQHKLPVPGQCHKILTLLSNQQCQRRACVVWACFQAQCMMWRAWVKNINSSLQALTNRELIFAPSGGYCVIILSITIFSIVIGSSLFFT